jgi:hypothetical protein
VTVTVRSRVTAVRVVIAAARFNERIWRQRPTNGNVSDADVSNKDLRSYAAPSAGLLLVCLAPLVTDASTTRYAAILMSRVIKRQSAEPRNGFRPNTTRVSRARAAGWVWCLLWNVLSDCHTRTQVPILPKPLKFASLWPPRKCAAAARATTMFYAVRRVHANRR